MTGESGSGMNVIARYLHHCGPHRERPFIEVGVASLSADSAAVDLFGSEENGRVHYGLLEQANRGTLFLNDIGDMDLNTQAKLLAALESRSFLRAGSDTPVALHVRVIAATHFDLEQRISDGLFRKDLFYQLNVVPIQIPALREHREDIPELLNYYANYYVDQEKLPYRKFSLAAQNRLRNYHWPGNIRELMNLVQRLLIIGAGSEIGIEEVELTLGQQPAERSSTDRLMANYEQPLREAREQFERAYFEYQLKQHGGSVGKVAKVAGLERTHLYRKLRSLGIDAKNLSKDDSD